MEAIGRVQPYEQARHTAYRPLEERCKPRRRIIRKVHRYKKHEREQKRHNRKRRCAPCEDSIDSRISCGIFVKAEVRIGFKKILGKRHSIARALYHKPPRRAALCAIYSGEKLAEPALPSRVHLHHRNTEYRLQLVGIKDSSAPLCRAREIKAQNTAVGYGRNLQ